MNASDYEKKIKELEREKRILEQKLLRCKINRELLEEVLETHSNALRVRNEELEESHELIRKSEARYRELAQHDTLTGLPNRSYFSEIMSQVIENAGQSMASVALLFLDLDQFKSINDNMGHNAGDIVLKETAKRLLACVRSKDTVSRLGGDEFAVLQKDIQTFSGAEMIAERIMDTMSEPFVVAEESIQISVSIGISLYPYDDVDCDMLLRKADMAMYRVKKSGRNNYLFYHDMIKTPIRNT